MKVITVRMSVYGKTCQELIDKAEKTLASFLDVPVDELENKVHYEFSMYEANNDGIELSTFGAEVFAKLK